MKTMFLTIGLLVSIGWAQESRAQSTTGGQSGGSTASTGTGYLTPGKRPATSKAASMSIADEGASRSYMYVPPSQRSKGLGRKKNKAASPDGSDSTTTKQATKPSATAGQKRGRKNTGQ
jgi:hypothetical protein